MFQVSDEVVQNLFPARRECTGNVQAARDELKSLIIQNNFVFSKVQEALQCKEGDIGRKENFIEKLNNNKMHLLYSILLEHNSPYGECVSEFDWVLKLIMGTDALKSTRKPIVQLQLKTVDSSEAKRTIVYDIQKESLSKLITALDKFV